MAGVAVAAEWNLISTRYYRKPTLYTLPTPLPSLSSHLVGCAPFAGPVALIRDASQLLQLRAESARRHLRFFSPAGRPLASVPWDRPGGRIVSLAWSSSLTLLALVSDGTVHSFNLRAEPLPPFHIPVPADDSVLHSVNFNTGMVCVTDKFRIFCVPDFNDPKPYELADPGIEGEELLCVAVIDPRYTMSGNVEVLLAVGDRVVAVDDEGTQVLGMDISPLQKMAVSLNGKFIAAYTHDGWLLVLPTDFRSVIFRYQCEVSPVLVAVALMII